MGCLFRVLPMFSPPGSPQAGRTRHYPRRGARGRPLRCGAARRRQCGSRFKTDAKGQTARHSLPSAGRRPSQSPQDRSARGKWTSARHQSYATCVTAPCAREIFRADFGASSGADMCPASDAANYMPRARMVFADRVQIKAACSSALCCTLVLPIPSHDYCAKLLLALFRSDALATYGWLMPPRPETGRRRPGPSRPKRSAPSCLTSRTEQFSFFLQGSDANSGFPERDGPYRVHHLTRTSDIHRHDIISK